MLPFSLAPVRTYGLVGKCSYGPTSQDSGQRKPVERLNTREPNHSKSSPGKTKHAKSVDQMWGKSFVSSGQRITRNGCEHKCFQLLAQRISTSGSTTRSVMPASPSDRVAFDVAASRARKPPSQHARTGRRSNSSRRLRSIAQGG